MPNAFEKIRRPALLVLAAALPVSIALTNIVFFSLLGVWVFTGPVAWRRWSLPWGKTEKIVLLFFGASFLAACFGLDPAHSFSRIVRKDLNVVVLFFTLAWVRSIDEAKELLKVFIVATVGTAFLGCLQWVSGIRNTEIHNVITRDVPPFFQGWPGKVLNYLGLTNGRAMGSRSHPLRYSESLLLGMAWLLPFYIFEEKKQALWAFVGLSLTTGALAASQSRGSWLGAVCLIGLVMVYSGRRFLSLRLLCLFIPFVFVMLSPHIQQRARTLGDRQFSSNRERLHMWTVARVLFKERPLFGVGPGNVQKATAPFWTPEEAVDGGWGHLHNTFVQLLIDRGLIGLCLFGLFMLQLLKPLFQQSLSAQPHRPWQIGGVLAWAAFLSTGLTENVYGNMDVLMSFYFVMALTHRVGGAADA